MSGQPDHKKSPNGGEEKQEKGKNLVQEVEATESTGHGRNVSKHAEDNGLRTSLLAIAEFCYNNTQSETTKETLFYANYGYHLRFEPDLGTTKEGKPDVAEYITSLQKLQTELRAEMAHAQMSYAE